MLTLQQPLDQNQSRAGPDANTVFSDWLGEDPEVWPGGRRQALPADSVTACATSKSALGVFQSRCSGSVSVTCAS